MLENSKKFNLFRKSNIVLVFFLVVLGFTLIPSTKIKAAYGLDATIDNASYTAVETKEIERLPYGITYFKELGRSKYTATGSYIDQRISVLNVPSAQGIYITSWSRFDNNAWKMTSISNLIKDYEKHNPGWHVIAGINGDFFDISGNKAFPYQTTGSSVAQGDFFKSGDGLWTLGFKNDGSTDSLVWAKKVTRTTNMILGVYNENGEIVKQFSVEQSNTTPANNQTSVYFGTYNSSHIYQNLSITTESGVNYYYVEDGELVLPNSSSDFYGRGVITSTAPSVIEKGQFVVATKNQEVTSYLKSGMRIRVQYEWAGEFADCKSGTGAGSAMLLEGVTMSGVNSSDGSRMSARHPRTAIGRKADGTIVMLVVETTLAERNAGHGAYGNELAAIMASYGCVEAYNLDGGGSSTMVISNSNGGYRAVTTPADNSYRSDSNALLVVTRDPEISSSMVENGERTITVNGKIINAAGHKIDQLYAKINGVELPLVDGVATFTKLSPNTEYTCSFIYKDTHGKSIDLAQTFNYSTKTILPEIRGYNTASENDGFNITVDYRDRGKITNIADGELIVNDKSYYLEDGSIKVLKSDIGDNIKSLILVYEQTKPDGTKETIRYDFFNPPKILEFSTVLDNIINIQRSIISQIFN